MPHFLSSPRRRELFFVCAIAALSAWLMLYHLDNVVLWHDEATNALMASSLARDGTLSGWDGRNLFFGTTFVEENKYAIDENLRIAYYPPWPALPSALGVLLFGKGEFALRFPHALLGLMCLPAFWFLLRFNFPSRARLRMFAFLLFALSPIVILYVRQGRYYPDAILFAVLSLYCYQRFFRDGGVGWLWGLSFFTALNFLNHFTAGFSFAAALALWHLIFYAKQTSRRQWVLFAIAGGGTAAVCAAYLWWAGVWGGASWTEYGEGTYDFSWTRRKLNAIFFYFRDIVRAGWLPLWIALWWGWYVCRRMLSDGGRRRKPKSARLRAAKEEFAQSEIQTRRWAALVLLIMIVVALASVTPVSDHSVFADMRYMVMALPFVMLMLAACADWMWQKSRVAGGALLSVLLFSNFAGIPFVVQGSLCNGDLDALYLTEERFPLLALASEIRRDAPSATAEVVSYLRENAKQDDTIFVVPPEDSAVLLHYLGDKLIFCCGLRADSPLPEEKIRALGAPLYRGDAQPKWAVVMNSNPDARTPTGYETVYFSEAVSYPLHRPEMEYHCFGESSLDIRAGVFRLRNATDA